LPPRQDKLFARALAGAGTDDPIGLALEPWPNALVEDIRHEQVAYQLKGLKVEFTDEEWAQLHRHPPLFLPRTLSRGSGLTTPDVMWARACVCGCVCPPRDGALARVRVVRCGL
jgi:hypothetical protein